MSTSLSLHCCWHNAGLTAAVALTLVLLLPLLFPHCCCHTVVVVAAAAAFPLLLLSHCSDPAVTLLLSHCCCCCDYCCCFPTTALTLTLLPSQCSLGACSPRGSVQVLTELIMCMDALLLDSLCSRRQLMSRWSPSPVLLPSLCSSYAILTIACTNRTASFD